MPGRLVVAGLCWGCGLAMLAAATSIEVRATQCTPQLWSPAICIPAHADMPVQTSSGAYCRVDAMHDCVPETQTQCVDRYATAVAGKCEPYADYSNPTICTENYGVTIVEVHRYQAACAYVEGVCRCEFTRDTSVGPALIQVCQCVESSP